MPLPRFTYLSPRDLKEASALLAEHGDAARLMAGGTDLLIRLGQRAMTPEYVIGLRGLAAELGRIKYNPDKGLALGALVTLNAAAEHRDIIHYYPALAQSASHTATVQIRNMGTVVGNLCNAAPSADNACPLLVHEAEAVIVHPGGERTVPLKDFFRGPGLTALEPGEIVREVRAPAPSPRGASSYQKISARSKVDIAAAAAAAYVEIDEDGALAAVRLALGAVAPTPLRARRTEKMLAGRKPEPELLDQAASAAAEESSPITDVRASASWRRGMVAVLTRRALSAAIEKAESIAGCEQ
jgi:carbon-monoxide dehydrogenase medium subunit